jgi:hypothetical protein
MTFDGRARRAVQGIHRAVEVMEMSSTKAPQRIARFDQYRERKSRNQRAVALVVGLALPILLLVGAWRLLAPGNDPIVPATPTATQTPAAAPLTARTPAEFEAPFTYAVPGDWTSMEDGPRYFELRMPDASGRRVVVLSNVVAAATDCSHRPARGIGTSSDAITSWLASHPALDATMPRPVQLGAATGSYVDVNLANDRDPTCPNGLTLVTGPDGGETWGILGVEKERFYVLDLPSGNTVTIVIDAATSGNSFRSLIDEAAPVVESFRFLE